MNKLEDYLVSIPDFPKPGVVFRDITSILQDKDGLQLAIKEILKLLADTDFDLVAAPESRGFLLGMPIAYQMKKGFIPVRKKGKLPRETIRAGFEMEYARTELEMHKDAVAPGQKDGNRKYTAGHRGHGGNPWRQSGKNLLSAGTS